VRALLHQPPVLTPAEQATWFGLDDLEHPEDSTLVPRPSNLRSVPRCPRCRQPMRCVATWHAGQTPPTSPARAPP
jgi:hypothetical protein